MKCVHCGASVSRADWFCPNCRRSTGRARRGGAGLLWPLAAVASALAAALFSWNSSPRHEAAVPPLVTTGAAFPVVTEETPRVIVRAREAAAPGAESHAAALSAEGTPARSGGEAPESLARPALRHEGAVSLGQAVLTVRTPASYRTFVYLNGGTLLGEGPVVSAVVPAGRQTLTFWTPAIGGRSVRAIDAPPGQEVEVVEAIRPAPQFAPAGAD